MEQHEVWSLIEFGDGTFAAIMAPKTDEGAKLARERTAEIREWYEKKKAN